MSKVLLVIACLLSLGPWSVPAPAQAEGLARTIAVRIDPATSAVDLGGAVDLRVEVTNNGSASSPPLVVHLDITDPARSTSVDPEDWTATLSRPVGRVDAGATVTVDWTIQPISSGTFATYAVVLSPGAEDVATSNVLQVQVAEQRTLNPRGILLVALGVPGLIGGLLLLQRRLSRTGRR